MPHGSCDILLFSLCEVYMVVNMILAEAMIARALGAIAELKLRMVGVSAPADGAFMRIEIRLLLSLYARGLLAEVHRIRARALGKIREKIAAAEDEEVDHRDNGQEVRRERRGKDAVNEECGVEIRKIFHLYGDDVEKQHLHIRVEHGKGEKHRQIHILRREVKAQPRNKVHDKPIDDREDDAGEEIYIELRRAPIALKRITY